MPIGSYIIVYNSSPKASSPEQEMVQAFVENILFVEKPFTFTPLLPPAI